MTNSRCSKHKKRIDDIEKRIAQLEKEIFKILGPNLRTAVKRRDDGGLVLNVDHLEVRDFLRSNQ